MNSDIYHTVFIFRNFRHQFDTISTKKAVFQKYTSHTFEILPLAILSHKEIPNTYNNK